MNGLDRDRLLLEGEPPEAAMTEAAQWIRGWSGTASRFWWPIRSASTGRGCTGISRVFRRRALLLITPFASILRPHSPSKPVCQSLRRANRNYFPLFAPRVGTRITLWRMRWSRPRFFPGFFNGRETVGEPSSADAKETAERLPSFVIYWMTRITLHGQSVRVRNGFLLDAEKQANTAIWICLLQGTARRTKPALSRLDEILVKADLIEATREQQYT